MGCKFANMQSDQGFTLRFHHIEPILATGTERILWLKIERRLIAKKVNTGQTSNRFVE